MNEVVPALTQCNSWVNEADKSADDYIGIAQVRSLNKTQRKQ